MYEAWLVSVSLHVNDAGVELYININWQVNKIKKVKYIYTVLLITTYMCIQRQCLKLEVGVTELIFFC